MRVTPDDEVWRVKAVWHGPAGRAGGGITFPWVARYLAYAVFLGLFLLILLVEAITPLHLGIPPVWEFCIAILATYGVMGFVDEERPIKAVWQTFVADLRAPRAAKAKTVQMVNRTRIVRRFTSSVHTWRAR